MPYPYSLHELAHEEYLQAYEWYELKEKGLGNEFMNCVQKRLEQISEHPEHYSKHKKNFRKVKVENFPYIIIYEFFSKKKTIHISSIYHQSKNPTLKTRKIK